MKRKAVAASKSPKGAGKGKGATAEDGLPEEILSLFTLATKKSIDVGVWLSDEGDDLTVADFLSKLKSLALVSGLDHDAVTKVIVDAATSEQSMKRIQKLCGDGPNTINVPRFLALCQAGGAQAPSVDLQDAAELHLAGIETATFTPGDKGGSMIGKFSEMYMDELAQANTFGADAPQASSSAGDGGAAAVDAVDESALDVSAVTSAPAAAATTKAAPAAKAKPTGAKAPTSTAGAPSSSSKSSSGVGAKGTATAFSSTGTRPRPASADPRGQQGSDSAAARRSSASTTVVAGGPRAGAADMRRSSSAGRAGRASLDASTTLSAPQGATSPSRPGRRGPRASVSGSRSSVAPSTASLFVDLQVHPLHHFCAPI